MKKGSAAVIALIILIAGFVIFEIYGVTNIAGDDVAEEENDAMRAAPVAVPR